MSEQETPVSEDQPYGFAPVMNPDQPPKTVSKLGIASFIIGLVSLVAFIIAIIVSTSFIMDHIPHNGNSDAIRSALEEQFKDASGFMPLIIASLLMLASFGCCVVGLILGIVGACARNKRKTFPVIGIVLNALLPFGFICLFLLGIALGGTS